VRWISSCEGQRRFDDTQIYPVEEAFERWQKDLEFVAAYDALTITVPHLAILGMAVIRGWLQRPA
jgi:hypothetical protein